PVDDNQLIDPLTNYRPLWETIRTGLPRKGRRTSAVTGDPVLPVELEGAIESLYQNYQEYHDLWQQNADALAKGLTSPVFIVVCSNTNVSKLVYDYIAGYEKALAEDEFVVVPGKLALFSNVVDGRWSARP